MSEKSKNNRRDGKSRKGVADRQQELVSPGPIDRKKGDEVVKKIMRENQEWLKEMANR